MPASVALQPRSVRTTDRELVYVECLKTHVTFKCRKQIQLAGYNAKLNKHTRKRTWFVHTCVRALYTHSGTQTQMVSMHNSNAAVSCRRGSGWMYERL